MIDPEDDEDVGLEPDDPDAWLDHSEGEADERNERADHEGWPVI